MSTLVALKKDDIIVIGSDSRASSSDGQIRPWGMKKFFKNGKYIIGGVGSIRGIQIFYPEYFTPPKKISDFPVAMIEHSCDNACLTDESGVSISQCNYVVIDTKKRILCEILCDFQMNYTDMTALGSGAPFAFGSLQTSMRLNVSDPVECVRMAVETAIEFDATSGGEVHVLAI